MRACPKCGSTEGLYMKEWCECVTLFNWDGLFEEDLYTGKERGGNMMYCRACNEPVMRTTTFFRMTGQMP